MSPNFKNFSGWAMRASDGRMVHVEEVRNGLDCGCICPGCRSPLIARQGKRRIWHFAHTKEECSSGGETALHIAAKQTLFDLKGQISLPKEAIRKAGWPTSSQWFSKPMARLDDLMTQVFPERLLSDSNVRIEPTDWMGQGIRPDAVLESNGIALLVEIRVTHRVEAGKRRRMKKLGLGAFEIDLSKASRSATTDELKGLLVSEAPRDWLVTGRKETWKRWEAECAEKLKNEASRLNKMVPRELTSHGRVNACPRRNEPDFEVVDVFQCQDCNFFGGHLGEIRDTPLWSMLDGKILHSNENSVLCGHKGGSYNLPTEKQKSFVSYLAQSDLEREGGLTASLPNDWEKNYAFCTAFIASHPDCKFCGQKMRLRRNLQKSQFFWGCSHYPSCCGTTSYTPQPPMQEIVSLHEQEQSAEQQNDEKLASGRALLARPEAGRDSLSKLAMPGRRQNANSKH